MHHPVIALLYLTFIIKETTRMIDANEQMKLLVQKINELILTPLVDMFRAIFKIRPNGLHVLIAIQLYMYASYAFVLEEKSMKYLYLLKVFEGFTAADWSIFCAVLTSLNAVGLLLLLPILSKVFHFHDSLLLTICVGTESIGIICQRHLLK